MTGSVDSLPGAEPPLHVVERGPVAGPSLPVLLVHGGMDRSTSFARLWTELADRHVIAYDRRGYARSIARPLSDDFGRQVEDLLEVVDGRRVVAFGHSFGGDVVLAAAAAHPELIAAAVVWEPPMPWLPWWPDGPGLGAAGAAAEDGAAVAEHFMVAMVGHRIWDRLPERTRRDRRAEGTTLVADVRSIRSAPWEPSTVLIPVIVGRGSESRPHQLRSTEELASLLPQGTLRTVPGSRHGVHLSHPRELAALIREADLSGTRVGTTLGAAAASTPQRPDPGGT